MSCGLETFLFSTRGFPTTVPTFFVAVALTNLEDPENAKRAYAEAVRLDKYAAPSRVVLGRVGSQKPPGGARAQFWVGGA